MEQLRRCQRHYNELGSASLEKMNSTDTKFKPARPRRMRFTSRVVHPPASGVPASTLNISKEVSKNNSARGLTCGRETRVYIVFN